jgi:predicted phosphodiesterase
MIDLLFTSDTHGYLPKIEKEFNLLGLCGDICPAHDHYVSYQREWLEKTFVPWVKALPFKDEYSKVIVVGGNHDFVFERCRPSFATHLNDISDGRLIVLRNEFYSFVCGPGKAIKVFATPYCKLFGNWAFMRSNDVLINKYGDIPEDLDLLMSHDSPKLNGLGFLYQEWHTDAGNPLLDNVIIEKKPKMFFSGHLHSGNHEVSTEGETTMANVAFVDERYIPTYPVLGVTYDPDERKVVTTEYIDTEAIDSE